MIIHHYKPKKKATTDKKFYHTIKVNKELLDISGYCPYVDGALVLTKPKLF